ncbi:VanZ family protein [Actinosynnema sp. NPDC050436]|uniref:VanZ family protein n=1 Tax=Actinosynnema sp. NPDC050436 TaxID=3155659 RepID=UPI0033F24AFE
MSVRMTESIVALILFALVVPLAVLPWVHRQYRRFGRLRGWSAVVAAAGVLYGCGLVAFTLFPLPVVTPDFCAGRRFSDSWQLHPLASLDDILRDGSPALWQVLLNVVLFVPMGFLLRYRFGRGPVTSAVVGVLVSASVELVQGTAVLGLYPCPYRLADVDDVLTNTTGTVVGWLVAIPLARVLPPANAEHDPDLAPPGLPRRGLAFAGDLLVFELTQFAILVVMALSGGATRELAESPRFTALLSAGTLTFYTLVVPLLRTDRATPGQVVFHLALRRVGGGRAPWYAVLIRFAVWWLPVLALSFGWVALLTAVIAVPALLRRDRRSLLGLLSHTQTTTKAAARAGTDLPTPADDRSP